MSRYSAPARPISFGSRSVSCFVSSLTLLVFTSALAMPQARTARVTAGEQYARAPGGQEWMLGDSYRDLWSAPIDVEILDMEREAGGLRPVMRVGGNQTLSLALAGADGRAYTFRSLDKRVTELVPEEFLGSGLEDIAQDQTSSALPGGEVIVSVLAGAAGVLEPESRLVVLPDDPALGEFRETFAGVLGTFHEFPRAGFHGATEVLDPDDFLTRWDRDPDSRVDVEAFLKARLLDLLIGDWDRHHRQWRWARIPGKDGLQPIPEDRDQAFSSYDGLALSFARLNGGQLVEFREEYPSIERLTANGTDHDRYILAELERPRFMAVVEEVQSRWSDDVIHEAVTRLPPEYYALRGAELESILRRRRDDLSEIAAAFYARLAESVDIHCTDLAEEVLIERFEDGVVVVRISRLDDDAAYFERRFHPSETDEIRVYTMGADDRVITRGASGSPIRVRVISGTGPDTINDPTAVRLYSDPSTPEGQRPSTRPASVSSWTPDNVSMPGSPPRDTGRVVRPLAVFGYHFDPGVILGAGVDIQSFGFRKYPWAQHHVIQGGFGFAAKEAFFEYDGDFRREESELHFGLFARASGLDQLRYYGSGNETPNDQADDFYRISDLQVTLFPAVALGDSPAASWKLGPIFRYSDTGRTRSDTLLAQERPYGMGSFGEIGIASTYRRDTRDPRNAMGGGINLRLEGSLYPEAWDVESTFGAIEADFGGHIQLGAPALLSLYAGGKKLWGEFPFFEAAYIGGSKTTDGYHWNRFAGDASLYGGLEFRWAFRKIRFTVPGELGLTLRSDVGRVFLEGEDSKRWHSSGSVAVFYAPFRRLMLFEAGVGRSTENTFLYVRGRLRFLQFE